MKLSRLHGLDALRGVAALVVLIYHLRVVGAADLLPRGYLAVNLFFALSGYVMARTYEPAMAAAPVRFMGLRLRKLYPLMALGAVLGLAAMLLFRPGAFRPIMLVEFALLPSFVARPAYSLNPPAWSIFQELFGNFLHCALLCHLGKRWLVCMFLVLTLLLIWMQLHFNKVAYGPDTPKFLLGLIGMAASYVQGIILWRLWGDKPPVIVPPWIALAILPLWAAFAPQVLDLAFIVLACPLILIGCVHLSPGKALAYLGALSFPLYALHYPIVLSGGIWIGLAGSIAAAALVDGVVRWRAAQRRRNRPALSTGTA